MIGYLILSFSTKPTIKDKPNIFWLFFSSIFIIIWFFLIWLYSATTNSIDNSVYEFLTLAGSFLLIFVTLIKIFNSDSSNIKTAQGYKLLFSISITILIFSAIVSFAQGNENIGIKIILGGGLGLLVAIFWRNIKFHFIETSVEKSYRDIDEKEQKEEGLFNGSNDGISQIKRSISFPPEFKQSGIAILSYFSEIISSKYSTIEVAIKIEQKGNIVTLIVGAPDGSIEKIEHELSQYGLVIIGEKSPEDYMDTPYEVMMLKHKIEIANLETKQTRDLLYSENKQYSSRIKSLEKQIHFLQNIFDKQQYESYKILQTLRNISEESSSSVVSSIQTIITLLEKGLTEKDEEEFIESIKKIKDKSPSSFEKIYDLFIKGAIQGTSGNYLYAWIQSLNILK